MVAVFENQIQSEYYGGNIFVYIEGITLEHFRCLQYISTFLEPVNSCHRVLFQSLFSHDRKQDSATTSAHCKLIIEMLKNEQLIFLVLLQYGMILMVVMCNTDVQPHYI